MTKIVITGIAGFIGYHLALKLNNYGYEVLGFDDFNEYYDVTLKRARADLLKNKNIQIENVDLKSDEQVSNYITSINPDIVVHLAAYAGVRHSFTNASQYILNNIVGTQNLIDACEKAHVAKIIYASTSCVMAGNELPWKEDAPTGHQLNPYGYTKRTNECQFITSSIPQAIGLRFFTVYGPYGRPDMALFEFSSAAVEGRPINVFNYGNMKRDFTYIDDIVNGIGILVDRLDGTVDPTKEIYNIGRGQQVDLMDFISEIEYQFNTKLEKIFLPKHPADTVETWSDTTKLQTLGWKPYTSIPEGVEKFANWYKEYYNVT